MQTCTKLGRLVSQVLRIRNMTQNDRLGPVQTCMLNKLQERLKPDHIEVINESYMHSVPKDSETHFKVVVVSREFEGLSLLRRHRLVFDTLKTEMESGVHALSVEAKTPLQWASTNGKTHTSPPCLGGMKR